jgi:NAD(P)H-hydrate repair Nnr-like enzyme with NAD(P)H-hydrate dehydratase domain
LAQGVVFANGKVALASGQTVTVYEDFTAMAAERCGDGKTRLLWNYEEMAYLRHLLPQFPPSNPPADAGKEK